ncbi:MAG: HEAT repeat domain-containing protein [Candidatus Moduliflexus flocculans]|nr:HEAT repeat domain-containing protein [Candidatus Moduliflexus flocculans]
MAGPDGFGEVRPGARGVRPEGRRHARSRNRPSSPCRSCRTIRASSALIKLAKTHPDPRVRKKAVFWLGECDDPRALEALIAIVKGK